MRLHQCGYASVFVSDCISSRLVKVRVTETGRKSGRKHLTSTDKTHSAAAVIQCYLNHTDTNKYT